MIRKGELILTTNYIEDWYENGFAGLFVARKTFSIKAIYFGYMLTRNDDSEFEQFLIDKGLIELANYRHFSIYGDCTEETYTQGWYKSE